MGFKNVHIFILSRITNQDITSFKIQGQLYTSFGLYIVFELHL